MADTLTIVQGADRDFARQVRDASGEPFDPDANPSPFLSSDALTATVWPGGNLPASFAPAVTWLDPTVGTFQVTVAAAQTTSLKLGLYRYQAFATRSGRTAPIDNARFAVTQTPGSGTENLAFTTLADLLLYAPWIEDLQADSDEAGFESQQVRATQHLIDVLVEVWQNSGGLTIGQPGFQPMAVSGFGVPRSYYLREILTPLPPLSTPPANMPDRVTWGTPANFVDPTLSTALLLYPEVKEVCAKWAISYACKAQIGRDGGDYYAKLGGYFADEADGLYFRQSFQIDQSNPQTGTAGIEIRGDRMTMRGC